MVNLATEERFVVPAFLFPSEAVALATLPRLPVRLRQRRAISGAPFSNRFSLFSVAGPLQTRSDGADGLLVGLANGDVHLLEFSAQLDVQHHVVHRSDGAAPVTAVRPCPASAN